MVELEVVQEGEQEDAAEAEVSMLHDVLLQVIMVWKPPPFRLRRLRGGGGSAHRGKFTKITWARR